MKVFLVDDHAILLNGLVRILEAEPGIEVLGTAGSVKELLERLEGLQPEVLISDYSLPDGTGLGIVRKTKESHPGMKVIVLSMHEEVHLVKEVLKEGVSGYILKKDSHNELIRAVWAAVEGKTYLSPDISQMLVQQLSAPEPKVLLTPREREVLRLLIEEQTNKQIGERLCISERTVETHRKNIFRKTGTHNMIALVKYAYANQLL